MFRSPKFEVLGELGHGGMGTVYRARHVTLDTVYAVKVLNPALGADGELASRFKLSMWWNLERRDTSNQGLRPLSVSFGPTPPLTRRSKRPADWVLVS